MKSYMFPVFDDSQTVKIGQGSSSKGPLRWLATERCAAERDDDGDDMSAGNVPEAVKQFVTCLYGHVRDKNGAFDGRRRRCDERR